MITRKHVREIKQNAHGMTKLLVSIPMSQRLGLAEISTDTSIAQQELIRAAIGSLLEHYRDGGRLPASLILAADEKNGAAMAAITQVAPGINIVREPTPAAKKALKAGIERQIEKYQASPPEPQDPLTPRPSPEHVWVVRGSGGYWRKTAKKASK